jgi:hypothetical protein
MENENSKPLSALCSLAADASKDRIPIADLLSILQDRAIVVFIVLFALPNVIPAPPGTSAVLGVPLLLLTAQWTLGWKPWLPPVVVRRSIARIHLERLLRFIGPRWMRLEGLLRPRFAAVAGRFAERMVGALCVLLALILLLPVPLGNVPPAIAISIVSVGFLRRDGLWVLVGIAAALASIAMAGGIAWALIGAAIDLLAHTRV